MITVRPAAERGRTQWGWLDSFHSFSFGGYHDPEHVQFRTLRVINDDRIAGGGGFGEHPHRDMEILTYVLEGTLEHRDSTGNREVIRPGDVQRMTAGSGITHSEYNHSRTEPVHLLQVWIFPERAGLRPGYEQKSYPAEEREGKLRLVAAPDGADGALTIHQDARVYATVLDADQTVEHRLAPGRSAWLQVARGTVTLNGTPLEAGDGAAVTGEDLLTLTGSERADVLLFDLA